MKKLLGMILALALCFALIPTGLAADPVGAANGVVAAGEIGDPMTSGLSWSLDSSGTLTIENDRYMSANDDLEYGICDGIIEIS